MEVFWDNRVVIDLFLGGLGIGTFLIGVILFYINPEKYKTIIKRSWLISPFLIIVGLLVLMTELGRAYNIMQTLFNVNTASVMSIGIYLQGICIVLMLIVLLNVKDILSISKPLVFITSVSALSVGLYHGLLLTGMEKAVWGSMVPMIFVLSSVIAGAALSLLISINSESFVSAMASKKLPLAFSVSLILLFVALFSWAYSLSVGSQEAKDAYSVLMASFSTEFYVWVVMVGIIIPLVLSLLSLTKSIESKSLFLPLSLCILVGGFFIKHLFVYLGQMV